MLSTKPWLPEHVLRLLIFLFAAMALLSVVMELAGGAPAAVEKNKWVFLFGGTLAIHTFTLGIVHLFARRHEGGWREAFGLGNQPMEAVRIGLIGGMVIIPLALLLNAISMLIFQFFQADVTLQPAVQILEDATRWEQQLAFGVLAVLAAPIVEEVVFRGMIYPVIKQHGYPRLALWGSAIFFAAIHAHGLTFVPLAFLGVALAVLYEMTDNLLAPITAHAFFNGANLAWLVIT